MSAERNRTLLLGLGNAMRGDDAVGVAIARALLERQRRDGRLPDIDIDIAPGEGADLVNRWEDYHRVYLFDAVRSGRPPGTVHRIDALRETLPATTVRHSSHAFSIGEGIALARVLDSLPQSLWVISVESTAFEPGAALSAPVAGAVESVVAGLLAELDPVAGPERG